jgi:hypothetical protein
MAPKYPKMKVKKTICNIQNGARDKLMEGTLNYAISTQRAYFD